MLTIIWNILFFVIALGILITIHELGHFLVARWCGIKVLTFKIGFGNSFYRKLGSDGVSYELGTIPLGGYVKMLDERDGEVSDSERGQAFNNKSVAKRFAVIAAGPLANFLLAIVIFWLMFMLGQRQLAPVVGVVSPNSPAAIVGIETGDEILQIGGKQVGSWQDSFMSLLNYVGEQRPIYIKLRDQNNTEKNVQMEVEHWLENKDGPDVLGSIGIRVHRPQLEAVIATVSSGSPASKGGLKPGDHIIAVDNKAVDNWSELVSAIHKHANKRTEFDLKRDGVKVTREIKIASQDGHGFLGVTPQVTQEYSRHFREVSYGPVDALQKGFIKTGELIQLSWSMLVKLLTGKIAVKNLAGPASIADGAGSHASLGLVYFLSFLGAISVNLGFVNLLPIPVLDGGHLLFLGVEWLSGKSVPEKVQDIALRFGLAIVSSIMLIAIMNDISRFI